MNKIASEVLKIAKGLMAETSSRETAKILSNLLGKKVSGGVGGKYPFYTISGENDRVIVDKGGKFYFAVPSDDGKMLNMKILKVAKGVMALSVGDSFENDEFRAHRYAYSIKIWDLTNAGKRGKKVDSVSVYDLDRAEEVVPDWSPKESFSLLKRLKNYREAKSWAESLYEFLRVDNGAYVNITENSYRGVDIPPPGFKPLKIKTPNLEIKVDYNSFVVSDLVDTNNLPTCIPAINGGKKDVKLFYRWVSDNESKIRSMSFEDVLSGMRKNGIKYHYYCAMD